MRRGNRWLLLIGFAAVQGLLLAWVGGDPMRSVEVLRVEHLAIQRDFANAPLLALADFFFVYVASSVLLLPGSALLSLSAGAVFGPVTGTLIASVASTLGALLAFLAVRVLAADWVRRRGPAPLGSWLESVDRGAVLWLVAARLVPFVPFFAVNAFFALTRMRPWTFVWLSWISMLPGTFAYVSIGAEFARLGAGETVLSPMQLVSPLVFWSLTLAGAAALGLGWRAARPSD